MYCRRREGLGGAVDQEGNPSNIECGSKDRLIDILGHLGFVAGWKVLSGCEVLF